MSYFFDELVMDQKVVRGNKKEEMSLLAFIMSLEIIEERLGQVNRFGGEAFDK